MENFDRKRKHKNKNGLKYSFYFAILSGSKHNRINRKKAIKVVLFITWESCVNFPIKLASFDTLNWILLANYLHAIEIIMFS
jgi:hypothetical protein